MAVGDPTSKGTDAETLGSVMAGGHVVDPVLCRLVHDPLGSLSGHVGIESSGHRLVEFALGAASHDAHRRYQPIAAGEDLGFTIAGLGDRSEKLFLLDRFREDATHPRRRTAVNSEALELFKSEAASQLGGVAQLEMSVQRQVVGDQ